MFNREILAGLDLGLFVDVCRVFFGQMGFEAKEMDSGSGLDLSRVHILYNKKTSDPLAIFQCYAGNNPIGLEVIGRFCDLMGAVNMTSGYLLSIGACAEDVQAYAAANRVNLVDGNKLIELVNKMPEVSRNLIAEITDQRGSDVGSGFQETESGAPGCAKCGFRMKIRITQGKYREGKYWECPNQDCKHIIAYFDESD